LRKSEGERRRLCYHIEERGRKKEAFSPIDFVEKNKTKTKKNKKFVKIQQLGFVIDKVV
jgi:hypothetical protein